MAVADGEPQLHFFLVFPVAHKKGTIWREKVRSLKMYTIMDCQGLIDCGCGREGREELGELGVGGCAFTYLAVSVLAPQVSCLALRSCLAVSVP